MAKVQGTFYTAERLRRGTSPISPPYLGEDGQPYPVNPPGSGNAPGVLPSDRNYQISLTKGLISGGIVTINADPTKIDISAGTGLLVDDWTDPQSPVTYNVSWDAFTALAVTHLGTSTFSNILITNSGSVLQTSDDPTDQERRENIYLVRLGHTALTQVESVVAKYSVAQSPMSQLNDLIDFVGLINLGNVISPNGTNLSINKSAGKLHGKGVDYVVNPEIPNVIAIASQVAPTVRRRTRTGVGTNSTVLDVGNYDVSGTITALVGVKYTNQRVYLFPNGNIVVQYGQEQYNSLSAAISGLETESFVIYENLVDAALIGVISVRSTATDLSDPAQAYFGLVSKIGEIGIGSGGGTTTATLQQIYDNSSDPEIVTDSTRGALTLRRGSASDTDPVFVGQNAAGSQTFAVTGAGIISDGTISPYQLIQEGAADGEVLTWVAANSRYEPVTPSGGSSNWTVVGSDIYRNSQVTVGQTSIISSDFGVKQNNTLGAIRIDSLDKATRRDVVTLFENATTKRYYIDNFGIPTWNLWDGSLEAGALSFTTPSGGLGLLVADSDAFTAANRAGIIWYPLETGATASGLELRHRNTIRFSISGTGKTQFNNAGVFGGTATHLIRGLGDTNIASFVSSGGTGALAVSESLGVFGYGKSSWGHLGAAPPSGQSHWIRGTGTDAIILNVLNTAASEGLFAVYTVGYTYSKNLRTANFTGSTSRNWKLGERKAATVAFDTTQYITVEVNGVTYNLALAV